MEIGFNLGLGDDLFVTNTEILARGISEGIANATLCEVESDGTLTETLSAIRMANITGIRSLFRIVGGYEDTFISDLGVCARGAGQIKRVPCPVRKECEVQRLLGIESSSRAVVIGVYPELHGMKT
ncbi:MAG: hypothetical protein Ct9H300mP8_09340 [Gammaproteobacteria bacterium]|nr:MAG: hypothetical protein Ct9H300mP8_09340 [Gammaproteobacteria bacterium]